jgi:radical SAM protein with 4Fe4S-binding SPASM domain
MNLKSFWKRWFSRSGAGQTAAGVPVGIYPFHRDGSLKYYLRVDPSGNGLLFAGGLNLVRLHPAGVFMTKAILEERDENPIIDSVAKRFHDIGREHIKADMHVLCNAIVQLGSSDGQFPLFSHGDISFSPEFVSVERPLSADVPLCKPFYMAPLLERLWDARIPHLTIVAGKNPAEKELVRAVAKAHRLGIIPGVRGFGSHLSVGSRIADLANAGLRHLDVVCLSIDEQTHDSLTAPGDYKLAIKSLVTAQKRGVCPVAVIPLVRAAMPSIEDTMAALAAHQVHHVSMLAFTTAEAHPNMQEVLQASEFIPAVAKLDAAARRHEIRLMWHPPVRRDFELTLAEQIFRGPRTSNDGAIRVEPDGRVFPARGRSTPAGNLLQDSWEKIASSRVYKNFRKHVEDSDFCQKCPHHGFCVSECVTPVEGPEEEE